MAEEICVLNVLYVSLSNHFVWLYIHLYVCVCVNLFTGYL